MSKRKYVAKTTRSRRKRASRKSHVVAVGDQEIQLALPIPKILAGLHGAVEALATEAGIAIIRALIDEEVEQHAGKRYEHDEARSATRWGSTEGFVVFGGKKVPIERPRVRSVGGGEVQIQRYDMFNSGERSQKSVVGKMVRGVSTRNYAGAIDDMCDGYGIEKSSVSRHWKAATEKELAKMMERPLGDLDLAVIMIDGIHFRKTALVVALGVDSEGRKHVLGLWDGATENGEIVKELLENLIERGLPQDRRYLFVLDGSKALRKGVTTIFGKQVAVQRCQIHKERNVLSHLPEAHQGTIRRALRAAWGLLDHDEAKKELHKLVSRLKEISPGAASSLEEGLDETITLHRLRVPAELRAVLRTTNAIENIFARTRELTRNVKRWNGAAMVMRWASTMLLYAEKKFRRVDGHQALPSLMRFLSGMDTKVAVA